MISNWSYNYQVPFVLALVNIDRFTCILDLNMLFLFLRRLWSHFGQSDLVIFPPNDCTRLFCLSFQFVPFHMDDLYSTYQLQSLHLDYLTFYQCIQVNYDLIDLGCFIFSLNKFSKFREIIFPSFISKHVAPKLKRDLLELNLLEYLGT